MQNKIYILVVEDESEVMDAILEDLRVFEDVFPIEIAASAEEAVTVVDELKSEDKQLGLILCDHILPGQNGVELLVNLTKSEFTEHTRKVLVTGQASHEDTIKAVNKAHLHHYISKPWDVEELLSTVKSELTEFVIEAKVNPLPFMQVLDAEKLSEVIRDGGLISDN